MIFITISETRNEQKTTQKSKSMTKQESAALNMAKFIRAQSLLLLEKLDVLDLDEEATICEQLHEAAETLYRRLETRFNDEEHQSDKSG